MKIEPQYVNFEQAKKLKEKRFDEEVFGYYYYGKKKLIISNTLANNSRVIENICVAPEHWQVIEWFRVNHGIWIEVYVDDDQSFGYLISKFTDMGRINSPLKRGFTLPKDATSEAIDYIIDNLI